MEKFPPVGENRPPCSPAPKNETQQGEKEVPKETAPPPAQGSPQAPGRETPRQAPAPPHGQGTAGGAAAPAGVQPLPPGQAQPLGGPGYTGPYQAGWNAYAPGYIPGSMYPPPAYAYAGAAQPAHDTYPHPASPAAAAARARAEKAAAKKQRQPFTATRADALFALACLLLGFLFLRWMLGGGWQGWGVFGFTVVYAGAVLGYAFAKGVKPKAESWFWMGIMLLCALSCAFWPFGIWQGWQCLLLFGSGVYWCACLFGARMQGKTGNLLPLDMANLLCITPFRNYDAAFKSGKALHSEKEQRGQFWRRLLPVILGICIIIPLFIIVVPMLMRADAGNIGRIIEDFFAFFQNWSRWEWISQEWRGLFWQAALGLPVAWYIAGLVLGLGHKRYAKNIGLCKTQKVLLALHRLPKSTAWVVLYSMAGVYLLFIGCQLPYFFSAFAGIKPEQFSVYSEYARAGFFELCWIAALNLSLMAAVAAFGRVSARESRPLRVANILLCGLTLLVIATAFSKMGLYIAMQGFTPKRIMTCVFMLFLAGVCVGGIVVQFKKFSMVRLAALLGAALLCALCLCNLNGVVVGYNATRYRDGSLPGFDEVMVLRSGPAGVDAALQVYQQLDDAADYEQKQRLAYALCALGQQAQDTQGTSRDNLTNAHVRSLALPWPKDDAEARNREQLFLELLYRQTGDGYDA